MAKLIVEVGMSSVDVGESSVVVTVVAGVVSDFVVVDVSVIGAGVGDIVVVSSIPGASVAVVVTTETAAVADDDSIDMGVSDDDNVSPLS